MYPSWIFPDSDFFNTFASLISYSSLEWPKVTISPLENSDVTSFNTNTFDVADAECDVYPETFTTGLDVSLLGGGSDGGSTGGATFVAHDVKKNKVIRN